METSWFRQAGDVVVSAMVETSGVPPGGDVGVPPGGDVGVPPGGEVVVPPGAGPGGTAFTGTDIAVWMLVVAALFVIGGRLAAGSQASSGASRRLTATRARRVESDLEHGRREEACHVAPQSHG